MQLLLRKIQAGRLLFVLGLCLMQVDSSQAVPSGSSYTISIQPNWNAVAYQFSGTKRVTTDLGLTPESGDQMMVYAMTTNSFTNYTYSGSSWSPTEPVLSPGQGALYYSQRAFNWTISGSPNTPVLPLNLPVGVSCLVACQTNIQATFNQIVGIAAPSGTVLFILNPGAKGSNETACPSCFTAYTNVGGNWEPSTPVAGIGESVFISLGGNPPSITQQPTNQTVQCGGTATFTVVASGTAPLYYQWLSNSFPVSGGTNSQLVLSNLMAGDAADYNVFITNAWGVTNSTYVSLMIVETNPPVISCPANITVGTQGANGAMVTYTVTASDNCSTPTIMSYPPSGSMFPIGTTTVQSTAMDAFGNTSSCSFTVTVLDSADLGISIAGTPDPAVLSNSVVYTAIVTNNGPGLASNVVATVFLPDGITYNSAFSTMGTVSNNNGAVTCTIADLPPNATATITVDATATDDSIQIFTSATVSSETTDTNLANNGASFLSEIMPDVEVVEPFWFESTVISNGQLILTLAGPSNQTVAVNLSTNLTKPWTFYANVNLNSNGIGTLTVPLSSKMGGFFFDAQYTETLTPPAITQYPVSQTADVGGTVTFTVGASGSPTLNYQWLVNNTNVAGANANSLTLNGVTAGDSGSITVIVSNPVGTNYAYAGLQVRQWNYGIAPDPPYPSLLTNSGARHQIVPGFCLGSIESTGEDATPEPANFADLWPLPAGNDGVFLPSLLVPNQPAQIQVVASQAGKLDAWIDFNGDGNWADAGDQIFQSLSLNQGTNFLAIMVPPNAVSGQAWSRFRFSSAGGLSFTGDAQNGEVEDYPVTISDSPNLTLTVSAAPNPVAVGGGVSYLLTVTNSSSVEAYGVVVSNAYAAGVTSVVCSASQGTCVSNNGAVIAALGSIPPGAFATVNIGIQSSAVGSLTNNATVTESVPDSYPADNTVVTITSALMPPSIISGPFGLNLTQRGTGMLSVTAGGSATLGYQWYQNGSPVPLGTASSLSIYPASAASAGSYTVLVTNTVGAILSTSAPVTVQLDYDVTATADVGGTISPAGDNVVSPGANLTFNAAPDPGYTIDAWYLDGVQVQTNLAQYTLSNIETNHSLSVSFYNSTNYDIVKTNGPWYYNTNGVDLGTNWSQPGYNFSSWSNGPALFAPPAYTNLYPIPLGTALNVGSQTTYYFLTQFQWYGSTPATNVTLTATNYITSGAVFYINGVQVGQLRMTNNPVTYGSLSQPQTNPGKAEILTFPGSVLVTGTNTLAVEVHQSNPTNADVAFAMNLNVQQGQKPTVTLNPTELTLGNYQYGLNSSGGGGTIIATGLPAGGTYQWTLSTNGIPAAQQGSIALVSQRTATNSIASVGAFSGGTVNVQVQYTATNGAVSEVATCVVNVLQTVFTTASTNGTYNLSSSAPLFNPTPIVVLNAPANPGTAVNPQMQVTGTVTSFIAPIAADHVFINGVPAAAVTQVSSGSNGLGPFVGNFTSQNIYIGDDDFSIVASAVNALNNVGYNSIDITVNRNLDGSIGSRTLTNNLSVPAMPANLSNYTAPYRCQIQVTDAKQAAITNTITASVNTGVDSKTVTLTNGSSGGVFSSGDLYYVPISLALPNGTSAAITASRIKAQFGQYVTVTYQAASGAWATNLIVPTGVLIVQNRNPLSFIQSGVAADVTAASADIPFNIEVGLNTRPNVGPGNASVIVTSLDKYQQTLAGPSPTNQFAPVQLQSNVVTMVQATTNNTAAQYLYTNSTPAIMAIRRRMPLNANGVQQPNPKVTPLTVTYRGYVSVVAPTLNATNIDPVSGIGYLLASPSSPTSTNLNPPMVESDFLPEFNPNPIVLVTSPPGQAQIAAGTATVPVTGQIINFINPTVQANVTVNGTAVTMFTPDGNSPQYGPWRATFSHTFPIDPQMPYQVASAAVWDFLNDLGIGRVGFTANGGGIDANGNAIAVTGVTPDAYPYTIPTNAVVSATIQSNSIPLGLAMAVLRNNQFRIEANPILRGNLPWMFNNNSMTVFRQTDGVGTTDPVSVQTYPFDVTTNAAGIVKGGGGAATARLVLIPQLATADNVVPPAPGGAPQVLSFRANAGVFVQSSLKNVAGLRNALASPNGAYIMRSTTAQADTVVPGTYADIGGNPADISVLLRVGGSGFTAAGAGQPTVPATFNSLNSEFTGQHYQPLPRQLSRNDLAPPAGAMDRQQWENFPIVTQNMTLTRWSSDTTDPRFNLYKWQQTGAATNEQPMTVVSTGTYPAAATRTALQVSTVDNTGLQFAEPGTWVQLQCAIATNFANKPVFGANFPWNNVAYTSTQTGNNGLEINNNFSGHPDFCIQMQERPITLVSVNPGPPVAAPVNNFWLRAERTWVAAATDLVPAGQSGNQVVAYLDTDPAAGFQADVAIPQAGYYRFPPSASGFQTLINIGTTGAGTEEPVFGNVPSLPSQTAFEGATMPNVAITQNNPMPPNNPRAALPPGLYWLRPVMLSPTGGGRYVLGRRVSYTVPYVVNFIEVLDAAAATGFPTDMNATYGLISGPNAPPAVPAGLTAAQQLAMQQAYLAQFARVARRCYGTATSAANRDVYVANTPNIRIVTPSYAVQPQIIDFVVPVNIGGNRGAGKFGGANTFDVLNSSTDETALSGGSGVYTGALYNAYLAQGNSLFTAFRAPNQPYGALAADNPANLQTALLNGILAMAGPINLGTATRDSLAMNAATAFTRAFGTTLAHEVGHTLGVVAPRADVTAYIAGPIVGGAPAVRFNSFHVGSDFSYVNGDWGQAGHEGQIYKGRIANPAYPALPPAPPVPEFFSLPNPPAALATAANMLPTYLQAVTAIKPGTGIPVSDNDDLGVVPANTQNLLMDSGSFRSLQERVESANSMVTVNPAFTAAQLEPVCIFTPRDLLQIRAVLPRN